jgi:bifunctional DNA-binding transcriptional regulator/antitoxin component of YhaV-PrlF toxin-antitoxin module
MNELIITARGHVTFRKDVLQHLGIEPGQKIVLDKLPGGRIALSAQKPAGKIDDFCRLAFRQGEENRDRRRNQ